MESFVLQFGETHINMPTGWLGCGVLFICLFFWLACWFFVCFVFEDLFLL